MMLPLPLLALISTVSAHAVWQDLWVNGQDQASKCVRMPKNNSPLTDVKSTDMRCNVGGAQSVPGLCDVNSTLTFYPRVGKISH
jgi:cellulase